MKFYIFDIKKTIQERKNMNDMTEMTSMTGKTGITDKTRQESKKKR